MKQRFKKHLNKLERLRMPEHPDWRTNLLLNRNERVIPYAEKTIESLLARLAKVQLNQYPDMDIFYKKLARHLAIRENQIYITEGVSGGIKAILETLAKKGDNVVFPVPTFALYPVYCRMFDVLPKTVGYKKDYKLDLGDLKKLIDRKTAVVFLPNPNVPIEGTLNLGDIALLAEYCRRKGAFLAIDEVYFPFGGPTAKPLIDKFNNIFLMRSFSKAFGLAGIRVGYVMSDKKNIEYISKMRTGYEANSLSMEVASFFIDHYDIVESYVKDVKGGFKYLKEELDKIWVEYNGGDTSNFLYINIKNKENAKRISKKLKANGIHIRTGWPEPYDGGILVTGGPKYVMERFFIIFKEALKK